MVNYDDEMNVEGAGAKENVKARTDEKSGTRDAGGGDGAGSGDVYVRSMELHRVHRGKIRMESRVPIETMDDLALAYTPGVAQPCRAIEADPEEIYRLTSKGDWVAVVTDGTAVLGLGDIGPAAALPVMEGKCCLFKRFAGIDAFPICVDTADPAEFVETLARIGTSFGGINLEDISAPRCFEIERKLQDRMDIPVFHDDQHGTAVIVLAGLRNALSVTDRKIGAIRIVLNGIGAAGTAIARILIAAGAKNLVLCDRYGIMEPDDGRLTGPQRELAAETNPEGIRGDLTAALRGADAFVGISKAGLVTEEMVRSMRRGVVFAMANPTPEIFPDLARAAGAAVVATGRSDFPNQVNNCLGFPGIFRGTLDVRARRVSEAMKLAASEALAALIPESELGPENILPRALDPRVVPAVAAAVALAARRDGLARA
jgi:malate dehydrogenase (oxaloacetate-decarboxylating)